MALFDWHKHFDPVLSYLNETGNTRWTTALKEQLTKKGYQFNSQTDSELMAHQLDFFLNQGSEMLEAMSLLKEKLPGACEQKSFKPTSLRN